MCQLIILVFSESLLESLGEMTTFLVANGSILLPQSPSW